MLEINTLNNKKLGGLQKKYNILIMSHDLYR